MEPTVRVIRAIPTFGTCPGVTTHGVGINQLRPNIPLSRMTRMIWIGGIAPIVGCFGGEEG
jgi:hypothetical protein